MKQQQQQQKLHHLLVGGNGAIGATCANLLHRAGDLVSIYVHEHHIRALRAEARMLASASPKVAEGPEDTSGLSSSPVPARDLVQTYHDLDAVCAHHAQSTAMVAGATLVTLAVTLWLIVSSLPARAFLFTLAFTLAALPCVNFAYVALRGTFRHAPIRAVPIAFAACTLEQLSRLPGVSGEVGQQSISPPPSPSRSPASRAARSSVPHARSRSFSDMEASQPRERAPTLASTPVTPSTLSPTSSGPPTPSTAAAFTARSPHSFTNEPPVSHVWLCLSATQQHAALPLLARIIGLFPRATVVVMAPGRAPAVSLATALRSDPHTAPHHSAWTLPSRLCWCRLQCAAFQVPLVAGHGQGAALASMHLHHGHLHLLRAHNVSSASKRAQPAAANSPQRQQSRPRVGATGLPASSVPSAAYAATDPAVPFGIAALVAPVGHVVGPLFAPETVEGRHESIIPPVVLSVDKGLREVREVAEGKHDDGDHRGVRRRGSIHESRTHVRAPVRDLPNMPQASSAASTLSASDHARALCSVFERAGRPAHIAGGLLAPYEPTAPVLAGTALAENKGGGLLSALWLGAGAGEGFTACFVLFVLHLQLSGWSVYELLLGWTDRRFTGVFEMCACWREAWRATARGCDSGVTSAVRHVDEVLVTVGQAQQRARAINQSKHSSGNSHLCLSMRCPRSEIVDTAISILHECESSTRQQYSIMGVVLSLIAWPILTFLAYVGCLFIPFDMERFLEYHFEKTHDQMLYYALVYYYSCHENKLPNAHLHKMIKQLTLLVTNQLA